MNPRAVAIKVLLNVIFANNSLAQVLPTILNKYPQVPQQNFIKEICYGVSRWYFQLDAITKKLMNKPLKNKDHDIYILILIGLYQLIFLRIADHAAVNETVNTVKELKKPWATQLINGVLRSFIRNREQLLANINSDPVARYSHPQWLMDNIKKDWPNYWEKILIANNEHPPLCLRVNQTKITREDYLAKLAANNIQANAIANTSHGIILETPINVQQLPGFSDGLVSVQDGAAQLVAELLELAPNQRILDACAAPGGKAAHILEIQPDSALTAIDIDAERTKRITENLTRLGLLTAKLLTQDANQTQLWWDGILFDRILLDAPCSATGVIRRNPDIKLLRRATDITNLAKQQYQLLCNLWPLLKPNGLLMYTTCSILREENEDVIKTFLKNHADATEKKLDMNWGIENSVGRQLLPMAKKGMDGFYYAVLKKNGV